ncbi:MAG TPA: hypothetical protein VFT35_11930, partial [Gaiellaceae bacterium]|nr:hypothetical protein [Gaiellaceae bacterium]
VLAVAAPAIAGKGGNPNGGNGGGGGNDATPTPTATPTPEGTSSNGKNSASPSISIATVNGTAMDASRQPAPGHGSTVTFNATSGQLGGSHPMVELSCYQDLNGDGTVDTDLFGPDLMVLQLDQPDATFSMSGQVWTAGNATCHARLMSYGWKGGTESIQLLASTYDWTAAW